MTLPSVSEIISEMMQCYRFYQALFNYTHAKIRLIFKSSDFFFYPFVLKRQIMAIIKSI